MYTIIFSRKAEAELEHEIEYSLLRWGANHAKKYQEELHLFINLLSDRPLIYPLQPRIGKGLRVAVFKGNRVIYRINKSSLTIRIVSILSTHHNFSFKQH